MADDTGIARYRDVFAIGEFRALFAAHVQSVLGDQLARLALAVLVFERTGSTPLAALTYALTLIPDLVGGPLLAGLADRLPRRTLMVWCDLARAALVAMMAVSGLPIWTLLLLLVAVQLAGAPFKAARAAVVPAILAGDRYVVGNGLMNATFQLGLLGGFATGGPLVAWLGAAWTLRLDALTFVVSAGLIAVSLRPHPPVHRGTARTTFGSLRAGTRLVWHDRRLRYLLAIACLAGCYVVPMGLAVPYAEQIGAGTAAAGLLLAADPAGSALGAVLLTRFIPPAWRPRLLAPLAVATSAVLLPTGLAPGLWATVALWTLCGLLSAHDAVTAATFMRTLPDDGRGQAYGLAASTMLAAQGLSIALAGVLAEFTTPAVAITVFATAGVLAGVGAAIGWQRVRCAVSARERSLHPLGDGECPGVVERDELQPDGQAR